MSGSQTGSDLGADAFCVVHHALDIDRQIVAVTIQYLAVDHGEDNIGSLGRIHQVVNQAVNRLHPRFADVESHQVGPHRSQDVPASGLR